MTNKIEFQINALRFVVMFLFAELFLFFIIIWNIDVNILILIISITNIFYIINACDITNTDENYKWEFMYEKNFVLQKCVLIFIQFYALTFK